MTRQTLIALALGSCTLALLPSCNDRQDTAAKAEEVAIKTFNIKKQQVTDYGEWFGYLRGKNDTDIHPRVTGFLVDQVYKDGQKNQCRNLRRYSG